MPEGYSGIYGGLSRGLIAGTRTGLMAREMDVREKEQESMEEQRKMAASIGRMGIAFKFLESKHVPGSMKAKVWNTSVVQEWNQLNSRPGTQVTGEALLGTLDEWPDGIDDYVKQASNIYKSIEKKELTIEQGLEAMTALQVQASEDVKLAPYIERLKERRTNQEQQDTLRAEELLTSGGGVTPDEAAEWHMIGRRSPKAALDAEKRIQERRKEQRESEKPTKVGELITEGGEKVVVLERGGKTERINLGKTKTTEDSVNKLRWQTAMSAAGVTNLDPKTWTTQQAQGVLAEYNRSDPFKKALADIISGQGGGSPSAAPKNPKEEAEAFFGTFE